MRFRGMCRHVCGLDPVQDVLKQTAPRLRKVGGGRKFRGPDNTFDMVSRDNVLEHLKEPERVFAEVRRV